LFLPELSIVFLRVERVYIPHGCGAKQIKPCFSIGFIKVQSGVKLILSLANNGVIMAMRYLAFLSLAFSFSLLSKPITTCLDYTPFYIDNKDQKEWNGSNIETMYHISTKLSTELDMSIRAPFARCMNLLKKGDIDVVVGLIYTEERNKYLHMIPYSSKDQLAVFFLIENKGKFDINALSPKQVIGMHRAFALPDHIVQSDLFKHIVPITTVDTGLGMAEKGRIDGVLATISTGKAIIAEWPKMHDKFTYTPLKPGKDMRIYLGISRKSFLSKQLNEIKSAIEELARQPLDILPQK